MAISTNASNTYDPTASAQALTDKYTADLQARITAQTKAATATSAGLSSMKLALNSFTSSMFSLTSGKSLLTQAATLSNTAVGSATATNTAVAGTYSMFVEKVATNNQISVGGLGSTAAPASGEGTLKIKLGANSDFTVDLSKADTDGDNSTLSAKEIAAAINAEPNNNARVTASVITIGGVAQLVLTSTVSGKEGELSLDSSAMADGDLKNALAATPKQLVAAQNAVIWIGGKPDDPSDTSNRVEQSSNTFSNIDGVKMTFTKAQSAGDAPITMTVGIDTSATTTNAQSFVTAYNKLKAALDGLTDPGDPASGKAAGTFSTDSGVRVLRDQMVRALRETASGALATFGITAQRDGTLALDSTKLAAAIKINPTGLDKAIGNNSASAPSGIAGALDKFIESWTSSTGQLSQREASVAKQQKSLEERQTKFEADYVVMYNRYKAQFTDLQVMQARMAQTTSMFDALFGDDSSKK
ncbi:flagellar filament capping protein FliD [Janthinobacterium aquaticum]|uniref:flagellar filament capping protein FliD n=1 Tax=Janthinobacterium sp. FT58W TaxID=2654254 RepID=UPI001265596E|nr:flagellar filament capping protein FliD [Janthinobacterium sp. FT58W]KAB8044453.1 flagellar filament capping protein FliD [Janthinobacterium sp. FT58W]